MARQDNAFRLGKGKINLTSGKRKVMNAYEMYLCVEDGVLELTFDDGSVGSVDCIAGQAYSFDGSVEKVEIKSGKFHIGE